MRFLVDECTGPAVAGSVHHEMAGSTSPAPMQGVLFAHSRGPSLARSEEDSARVRSCTRANPNPLRGHPYTGADFVMY